MGQKIHPIGFRLAVNRDWRSRWFATPRDFAAILKQDIEIRDYVKKTLGHASVGRVSIERPSKSARITIFSARPGVIIGKKGEGIEKLRQEIQKKLGFKAVAVNIEELRKPELDAKIIADNIAQQLEKRVMFRRAMRRAIQQTMRLGAQGIKIMSSGRLNGIEIARSESYREGRVPMHTLRSNIDYALSEAKTTYGIIGIKVWVYRGDHLVPEVSNENQKNQLNAMIEGEANQTNTSRIIQRRVLKKSISDESNQPEQETAPAKAKKKEPVKLDTPEKKQKTPMRKTRVKTEKQELVKPDTNQKTPLEIKKKTAATAGASKKEKKEPTEKIARKNSKKEDASATQVKSPVKKKTSPKAEKPKKDSENQGA